MYCGTCPFYSDLGSNIGDCRRYPPKVISDVQMKWPVVSATKGWCGEHPKRHAIAVDAKMKAMGVKPALKRKKRA